MSIPKLTQVSVAQDERVFKKNSEGYIKRLASVRGRRSKKPGRLVHVDATAGLYVYLINISFCARTADSVSRRTR